KSPKSLAKILAQSLYYIRRLKFGIDEKTVPPFICLADKNETAITETKNWQKFYNDENFDWDFAPSTPDENLVAAIVASGKLSDKINVFKIEYEYDFKDFSEKLKSCFDPRIAMKLADKKIITEENFENVFERWNKIFGESVENGFKSSRYFVADIQKNRSHFVPESGKVIFEFTNEKPREKKIVAADYEKFWNLYEKVGDPKTIEGILAKIDRLTDDTLRRFEGEFFTPLDFARKGLQYLEKTLGKKWYNKYKIWDMAAGTGNLEYYLPEECHHNFYLSTIDHGEVDHLKRLFPWAQENCFHYDYLNNDVENLFADEKQSQMQFEKKKWKLPENLRRDLADPKNKWVVLINPPFATSGNHGASSKKTVAHTKIRDRMERNKFGNSRDELFIQFLFRIKKELPYATLGLFSKLKYLNSTNYEDFRKEVFDFKFKNGFIFSSENFQGTRGKFPVGFLVWDLAKKKKLAEQKIILDVFEKNRTKIGQKEVRIIEKEKFLNRWVKRPRNTKIVPPLSSAIKQYEKDVRLDKLADGAIGYFWGSGNDFQQQNLTAFFSAPFGHADGWSITPKNFEQSMMVHAVRRIPKATWINDRDQFKQPKKKLPDEFVLDCVVWSLFAGSNQSSALRDVDYLDKTFQIENQFFPFPINEVLKWKITDTELFAAPEKQNTFVADFLTGKKLSAESAEVLEIARKIYQLFFTETSKLRTPQFKIKSWDAGWWQIRNSLTDANLGNDFFAEMKTAHVKLKQKILPQIYKLGFLDRETLIDPSLYGLSEEERRVVVN
ncbi:MAG: hypothetical protein ABIE14_01070, partial [Patescibacteria group bacterium]